MTINIFKFLKNIFTKPEKPLEVEIENNRLKSLKQAENVVKKNQEKLPMNSDPLDYLGKIVQEATEPYRNLVSLTENLSEEELLKIVDKACGNRSVTFDSFNPLKNPCDSDYVLEKLKLQLEYTNFYVEVYDIEADDLLCLQLVRQDNLQDVIRRAVVKAAARKYLRDNENQHDISISVKE